MSTPSPSDQPLLTSQYIDRIVPLAMTVHSVYFLRSFEFQNMTRFNAWSFFPIEMMERFEATSYVDRSVHRRVTTIIHLRTV